MSIRELDARRSSLPPVVATLVALLLIFFVGIWATYELAVPVGDKQLCEVFLGKPRCVGMWMNFVIDAVIHPKPR